ncbi:MAG: YHYH protein [Crocinitomicaceae bacterium]|nr:YHYH protein [Crocinitomicaceae bacterium]
MKSIILLALGTLVSAHSFAQGPEITSWLQNTTNNGTYYVSGNSTALDNGILYNCQEVSYSANNVYVKTKGVPAYPTGPFLDGNPSVAEDQDAIFQFTRNPQEEAGVKTPTTAGRIGVFINGAALFDYRDGVAWNPTTNSPCGGPGNPPCPGGPGANMDWNRDAIPAEMDGFDCSKGHPAMGTYHHHQNPSAFKLDQNVLSTICNLYDADGLYAIDAANHSPLIGFAYDGFPIYGAYGFANQDGTGGITRMKSGYELGNYSARTHNADGTDVDDGPNVDATYFLGYFREDYTFVAHPGQEDYLDEHNGRWCITPDYPMGTYAYFCTVDSDWNSAYPYAVGPTFYGVYNNALTTNITETVEIYDSSSASLSEEEFNNLNVKIYPNPISDLIAIQISGLVKENLTVDLIDFTGKVVENHHINAGQTIAYFDVSTLYVGNYFIRISNRDFQVVRKVLVK